MESQQRTDEWYDIRLGKATASRFADVLATTKTGEAAARRNYRAQLVIERLTGIPTESYSNAAMEWGVENEPVAKLAYEAETGNEVVDEFFCEHPVLLAGCSPDGLIGKDGLIETKCPNTATHMETLHRGDIPPNYVPQVQGQLWITERKWCDFVSFDPRLPRNAQLFIKRVERDEEYISELAEKVSAFLEEVQAEVDYVSAYRR